MQHSIHKIPMDCSDIHNIMIHYKMFLCLQAEVNTSNIVQVKPLLVYGTVGIILAYLNCHAYILFLVAFNLVSRLMPGRDLLVCP